jgi:hypothetical protein
MDKDYPARCQVCGKEHVVRASFISGTQWKQPDGRYLLKHQCGAHTAEQIRAAWLHVGPLPYDVTAHTS